jgi:hypothetical protein
MHIVSRFRLATSSFTLRVVDHAVKGDYLLSLTNSRDKPMGHMCTPRPLPPLRVPSAQLPRPSRTTTSTTTGDEKERRRRKTRSSGAVRRTSSAGSLSRRALTSATSCPSRTSTRRRPPRVACAPDRTGRARGGGGEGGADGAAPSLVDGRIARGQCGRRRGLRRQWGAEACVLPLPLPPVFRRRCVDREGYYPRPYLDSRSGDHALDE